MGRNVLFESLEMNADELVSKVISSELTIPLESIRTSDLDPQERAEILQFEKSAPPLFICEKSIQSVSDIVATIRARHLTTPLSLVVIDYIQLITVNNEENRATEIGNVTRALKCLAKDLRIPNLSSKITNNKNYLMT
jgi:replicative DNA helicase